MKKSILLSLFVVVVAAMLLSCSKPAKTFSGYISVDEKQEIVWTKVAHGGDLFYPEGKIKVRTPQGEITAWFRVMGGWDGGYCVVYHDSYPKVAGKIVYVSGAYDERDRPIIWHATLNKELLR
jgi:hypothetical protein